MLAKLQQVVAVLQQASGPLPEYELLEKLISAESDDALNKTIEENAEEINDEFLKMLGGIVAQSQGQEDKLSPQDKEMFARIEKVYQAVLKFSMKRNMGK
jgi:transcription termination factor NusB